MGGFGSGNRLRWEPKKAIVEESLAVGIGDFRGKLHPGTFGTLAWQYGPHGAGGRRAEVGWHVTGGDGPILTLQYRWRDCEDVQIPVRLQTTPTQFAGKRWWFTCPLIVGGIPCKRRVGKLFLPPGAKYFGCRRCHDLTYRSSQEAHQEERLYERLGLRYNAEARRLLSS